MAQRGCLGKVKSGATPDLVAEVTEISFDETADVLDGASMGTCTGNDIVGLIKTTGSVTVFWDSTDTGQGNFVVGDVINLELFPIGDTSGDPTFTSTTALITGRNFSSAVGSLITQSFTFSVQGAFTEGTVTP